MMMANTMFAAWAILSIGIFNSVMWPNIFDLGIANLGKYKEQGFIFIGDDDLRWGFITVSSRLYC